MTRDASARARIFDCCHCSAHCFFHCSPLFLRRRVFSPGRKAFHCNSVAFLISARLYFSRHFFRGGENRNSKWTAPSCEPRKRGSGPPACPGPGLTIAVVAQGRTCAIAKKTP